MENLPTYRLTQSGPEAQEILDQVNLNAVDIEQLKRLYQALNQSEPEIIEPNDTWPVANPEENVIYRVIDRVNTPPQYYSDYMWNGTSMVLMGQYNNAIDNEPTANSNNLVKSGGVYSFVHANGGAYDISASHAVGGVLATYDDLADALGTNGANVPAAVRKGGMSVKFVLTNDNKYVQYRLMATSWSTTVTNWQGVDNDPILESKNLIESDAVANVQANLGYNINEDCDLYNGTGTSYTYIKEFSPYLLIKGNATIIVDYSTSSEVNHISAHLERGGTDLYISFTRNNGIATLELVDGDKLIKIYQNYTTNQYTFPVTIKSSVIKDIDNLSANVSHIQNSIADIHPFEGSPSISGNLCFLSSAYALEIPKNTIKYSIIDYTNLGLSTVSCAITKIDNTTQYIGSLKLTDTISSNNVAIKSIRFYIDKPDFTPSGTILVFTSDVNETLLSFIKKNDEKYSNYNNVVLTQERIVDAFGIKVTVPTLNSLFVFLTPVLQIQGAPTSLKLVSKTHINRNIGRLSVIINGSTYTSVPSNNIITKPEGISTLRFYANKDGEYTDVSGYFTFILLNNGSLMDDLIPKPFFMKKIVFVGDSLTEATSDNGLGWAGRAGNILEMDWSNLGHGGYTTETGDADKSIIKTITNIDESEYVIVQPSTVNHQAGYTVGEITTSGTNFDTTTYYGALEYIAHYCLTHFNKCAFIIPYRVGEGYNSYLNTTLPQAIIDVGLKWGMPVLDLRAMAGFNLVDPDTRQIYGVDNTSVSLYNESASYVLDQKTRYNGRVYKAKQNISAPAGIFNSSLWTNIGTEYDNCHCNINGYKLITNKVVEFVKCL